MHSNHMSIFDREARLIEPSFTTEDRPNCSNVRAIRGYRKTASLDFVLAAPVSCRHSSLPKKRTKKLSADTEFFDDRAVSIDVSLG